MLMMLCMLPGQQGAALPQPAMRRAGARRKPVATAPPSSSDEGEDETVDSQSSGPVGSDEETGDDQAKPLIHRPKSREPGAAPSTAPLPGDSRNVAHAWHQDQRWPHSAEAPCPPPSLDGCAQSDSLCAACNKPEGSGKAGRLLCCDLCPRVYHLRCLDPPLSGVPRGDWHCQHCTGLAALAGVERILAVRPLQVRPRASGVRCQAPLPLVQQAGPALKLMLVQTPEQGSACYNCATAAGCGRRQRRGQPQGRGARQVAGPLVRPVPLLAWWLLCPHRGLPAHSLSGPRAAPPRRLCAARLEAGMAWHADRRSCPLRRYLHCSWVPLADLQAGGERQPVVKRRLQAWQRAEREAYQVWLPCSCNAHRLRAGHPSLWLCWPQQGCAGPSRTEP